ncbi:retrotransposon protein, putative, ty1-copia subclass [Tanacetum coccineum]
MVAKGYTQTYGVDYRKTFSPVEDIRAIRILLAIAAFYDYKIWQMDVKTAFLNGHLRKDVYMVQPEGFVDPKHPNKVCKLQRSIYGLKQASKSWNTRFDVEIKKIGFTQNPDEPCVYLKASRSNVAFRILIKIIRDRSKRLIALSQSAYLKKTLKKFRMENSKKRYTPMIEKPNYRKSQGAQTPSEVQCMRRVPYASSIGSIMCAVRFTRPDVAFAAKPKAELKVSCYADDSFQIDKDDTKSQMRYVFMRKFIDGLGDVMPSNKRPMEMLCDNEPVIAITNDLEILKGAKHFQRKYHYIRKVIQEREIALKKVHTDDNVADSFTKPMPFNKHYEHAMTIGIVPASSLM